MPEIIKHLRAVFDNQKLLIHKLLFLFIYFVSTLRFDSVLCYSQLSGWAGELLSWLAPPRMKDWLVR